MKYDIFISYSRKDFEEVSSLLKVLIEHIPTLTYWFDVTGIESGDEFDDKIITAINNSSYVLFALSNNSINSQWTKDEVMYAKNTGKKIIPVLLSGATLEDGWFLFKFGRIDCIDSTEPIQVEKLIKNLSNWTSKETFGFAANSPHSSKVSNKDKKNPKTHIIYHHILQTKQKIKYQYDVISSLTHKEAFKYIIGHLNNCIKLKKFWISIILILLFGISTKLSQVIYNSVQTHEEIDAPTYFGSILAHDGRTLAYSETIYNLYLDCKVQLNDIHNDKHYKHFSFSDREKIADNIWKREAQELSEALSNLLCKKSAEAYYSSFHTARYEESNRRVLICKNAEQALYDKISQLPLLRRGTKGGFIIEKKNVRKYPYGDLARRTLGYNKSGIIRIGIEGAYDSILRGQNGRRIIKTANLQGVKFTLHTKQEKSINGVDIHTTLAIPIQKATDNVLRTNINKDSTIYGGAVTIMDVKTGAIKAMSNIVRPQNDKTRPIGEYYNLAIGYSYEPGTILGCATLAAYLSSSGDHYKSICKRVDSKEYFKYAINNFLDIEIAKIPESYKFCHQQINAAKSSDMTIIEGVCKSNPYILATLALYYHGRYPMYESYLRDLYLTQKIDFDITGVPRPYIATPIYTDDYNYFLATLGCGYGIKLTQLDILTFYNIIANNGIRVEPYIIDSYKVNQLSSYKHITKTDSLTLVNKEPIITEAHIEILKSVMRNAVRTGSSGVTGKAKEQIAGLAGHGFQYLSDSYHDDKGYTTADGKRRWNSSFVGYFPADNPKYSIICTIVTYRTKKEYPGNDLPAKIVSEIYNAL